LQIEHQLQPMLGLSQETVGVFEDVVFLIVEATGRFERLHRLQGIPLADLRQLAGVQELKELDGEFNIPDSSAPGLDVRVRLPRSPSLLLNLPLERFDLVDFAEAEIFPVDEGFYGPKESFPKPAVAGDGAEFDERLTLPGSPQGIVV